MADQILEGLQLREARARRGGEVRGEEEKPMVREAAGGKGVAYVSRMAQTDRGEEAAEEGVYSAKAEVEKAEATEAEAEAETETEDEEVTE